MAFDRQIFWDSLTDAANMDALHVDIANCLLDEWQSRADEDPRWLAYIMATALDDHSRVEEPDIQTGCADLISGMIEGSYTGKRLDQFFTKDFSAWLPARMIIDPALGDAEACATDAKVIYDALNASSNISLPDVPDVSELPGMPDIEPPPEASSR